jgi:Domain of unknown function (DU1801)
MPRSTENKTQPTEASPEAFLAAVTNERRRQEAQALCAIMQRLSGAPPVMWGPSIVGFGSYRYVYASGRSGSAPLVGFSPRASALVLYIMGGFPRYAEFLVQLGKHKTGQACLYLNRLADAQPEILERLILASLEHMRTHHPCA